MTNTIDWKDKMGACIRYCKEQNGLPYCKNCGLDIATIEGFYTEARDEGYKEGARIQAEMDADTASQERERIVEWVKENEYCSKCCSPKKFCPDWGKHASAIDTDDLLTFLTK